MKVVLTGGGTGGHVYPALAIAEELQERYSNMTFLYIGTKSGLEKEILEKTDIPFAHVSAKGIPRKISLAFLKSCLITGKGLIQAFHHLRKFKPDVVIGTGGFVCGPTVLAAHLLKIPTIIHEQNAFPGITNRILAPIVDEVLINFEDAREKFNSKAKITCTGLPVRESIHSYTKEEGCQYFGLDAQKKVLLITGGSRGAQSLNLTASEAIPELLKNSDLQIIFVTGKKGYDEVCHKLESEHINLMTTPQLLIKDYLYDMPYALAAADIACGRAGATFLAEIAECGIPSILIPYPYASENHQVYNARAVSMAGGAEMILDDELTAEKLSTAIKVLLEDESLYQKRREAMQSLAKSNALEAMCDVIEKYLV